MIVSPTFIAGKSRSYVTGGTGGCPIILNIPEKLPVWFPDTFSTEIEKYNSSPNAKFSEPVVWVICISDKIWSPIGPMTGSIACPWVNPPLFA